MIIRSNVIETVCHQMNPCTDVKHITHMQSVLEKIMAIYTKEKRSFFSTILFYIFPDSYGAIPLLKEADINCVTCLLKLYLRELPEALFTHILYPNFNEGMGNQNEQVIIIIKL